MRQMGVVFTVALVFLGSFGALVAGCSLLLDTDTNPYKCTTDADCARYADNAVCDNARRQCVTRLPPIATEGGVADGGGDAGGLTCQLAFDNRSRVPLDGPDGGLRPLPAVTP